MAMPAPPPSITPHIQNIFKEFGEEKICEKSQTNFHLEIALNLINIRQTVTVKFRVGIKSVSQKWK